MNSKELNALYIIPLIIYPIVILCNLTGQLIFPYYFGWDSSLLYSVDTLLINGGLTPAHLFHPDIGALWFEKFFIFPLAKFLGLVEISTIQELQKSLNPYINFADLTRFLIFFRASYIYMAGTVIYSSLFFLYQTLWAKLPSLQKYILWMGIIVFSFYGPILILPVIIRYEWVGLFWWSLSLAFTFISVFTNKKRVVLLAGICSGLAFISKIVLLPNIITLVFIYYVLHRIQNTALLSTNLKERKINLWLTGIQLVLVFSSLVFILVVILRKSFDASHFTAMIKLSHMIILGALFPAYLAFQCFIAFYLWKHPQKFPVFSFYFHRLVLFVFSLFIPLLIIIFQKKGLHIFTNVYIFSFALGQISMSKVTGYNDSVARAAGTLSYSIIGAIIFVGSAFAAYLSRKNTRLIDIWIGLSLFGGALTLNTLFLRGNEAYLPQYGLSVFAFVLFYILFISQKHQSVHFLAVLIIGVSSLFALYNMVQKKREASPLSTSTYQLSPKEWFSASYGGNASLYTQKLADTYQNESTWNQAFYWARDPYITKGLLRSIAGSPNRIQDSSLVFSNSTLSHTGERLVSASPKLQGSLVLALDTAVINTLFPRLDYDFYLASSEALNLKESGLELTSSTFQTDRQAFYVYTTADRANKFTLSIPPCQGTLYLIITDRYRTLPFTQNSAP